MFSGPVGVGKTQPAAAILRELIQRYGIRGLFYQFGVLLKEIEFVQSGFAKVGMGVLQPFSTTMCGA